MKSLTDIAIKVANLSKCYQIYDKPQDRLLQMLVRGRKQYFKEFWALKDVSFEIKKGETGGIIDHNGSTYTESGNDEITNIKTDRFENRSYDSTN